MRRISFRHNPCLSCGACCAAFRVSFYWREADDAGGEVPAALVEDVNSLRRCMRGTNQPKPRCTALEGAIGERVACAIYRHRPSPCREFGVHRIGGRWIVTPDQLERCNHARALHGLPPLEKQIMPRFPRRIWPHSA